MPPIQYIPRAVISLLVALLIPAAASGENLLPPQTPIPEAVDHYIDRQLTSEGVQSAGIAKDYEIIRRTTLDLAGRIPTADEVRAYVESDVPEKREQLVERLMSGPGFAFQQRNWFDALLMADRKSDNEWREYLLQAARENRPWDEMFREMMIGKEEKSKKNPALAFLKARADSRDDMTNDTSRLFFGVNVSCAKCHDHPLVADWKQDHFYGMSSFFDRTFVTRSNYLGEKPFGDVKFKTTEGKEKTAEAMFLTGTVIKQPDVELSKKERKKIESQIRKWTKDKNAPPPKPPEFSLRRKFVETVLKPGENRFFARSIVNRVWKRLLGYGLVEPVDQMHSSNPPSHPQLLAWLERDLVAHEYDLKRLIRGIVLSKTYAQSSAWTGKDDPPSKYLFAVAVPRPLTPRQYALSLLVATSHPQQLAERRASKKWAEHRKNLERSAEGFARQIEFPGEHFQVSVDEALLFTNNERIARDYLRNSGDRLVGHLKDISDDKRLIATAYRAVLSRQPTDDESAAFQHYLNERKDRRVEAIQQMVWALITSPELRFNY